MYFFSGEATCLNVIPACVVMSVKVILACWDGVIGVNKDAVNISIMSKTYNFRPKRELPLYLIYVGDCEVVRLASSLSWLVPVQFIGKAQRQANSLSYEFTQPLIRCP